MERDISTEILNGAKTALIDEECESDPRLKLHLVYNNQKEMKNVLYEIDKSLRECDEFIFSVAFITSSGIEMLLQTLLEIEKRGVKGKILTTDYLTFSEPKALRKLFEFKNIEIRVSTKEGFHTKGYYFKYSDKPNNSYTKIMIGSANLTGSALKSNKEWNISTTSLEEGEVTKNFKKEFDSLWNNAEKLSEEWLDKYESEYRKVQEVKPREIRLITHTIEPNSMQENAIKALSKLRENGKDKALLIAATGTGKTYLSAFDVQQAKPKTVLFLVHRDQILDDAIESFKDVLGQSIEKDIGKITGKQKQIDKKYIFATVQTMSKEEIYRSFSPSYFDYIIIDEVHRAGVKSYQNIINYFKPKFLLGMSATPDRPDAGKLYDDEIERNIYKLFEYNIAYEIRLEKAMEFDLLCPFHYFGISDISIEGVAIDDNTSFSKLTSDQRVERIIEKSRFYGYDGDRVKGLIFCSKIDEAKELSRKMNQRGLRTIALTGSNSIEERENAVKRLEQDEYEKGLDFILTVDIFNEGVDIPKINQIIMLRATKSSIIFIQQLGRGLRKAPGKKFLVVIDFIANYANNFMIPIALSGDKSYNKDNLRRYIAEGSRFIAGESTVNFDKISKERIYKTIDEAKFNEIGLLKAEYYTLKEKLGHIPELADFSRYESIDIFKIIDNLGSYYNFLVKYDKEYKIRLNDTEANIIEFISRKIAKGKRISELVVLKRAIEYQDDDVLYAAEKEIEYSFNHTISYMEKESTISYLTNKFHQNSVVSKYPKCIFISDDGSRISQDFKQRLSSNPTFKNMILDLIELGIRRYQEKYSNLYQDTEFVLYEKYTYEEITRLLNWEKDKSAQIIGGYCYDSYTDTFPVFINYAKDEINAVQYEDRFIDNETLVAISKKKRSIDSKDASIIYKTDIQFNSRRIFIFMRKTNNDGTKEFYFLGEADTVGRPNPIRLKTGENAFEIRYHLKTPVRQDILDYMDANISYEGLA